MRIRLLITLAVLGLFPSLVQGVDNPVVLFVHSAGEPSQWTESITAGLTTEFKGNVEVRQEFLGHAGRDEDSLHAVFEACRDRYPTPPAAIVSTGSLATGFLEKYREDLFPNVPAILTGRFTSRPRMGGGVVLPLEFDAGKSLELLFSLRPDARIVVGIIDGTPTGQARKAALEHAMSRMQTKARLLFPGYEPGNDQGLDLDALEAVIAAVPADGVAILAHFTEDRYGNPVTDNDLVGLFVRRSVSPIVVLSDALLGSGVVGGVLVPGASVGREAAKLIMRIQAGERADEMLPEPVPAKVVLDGTALARFGMRVPSGATVVNALEMKRESDEINAIPLPWAVFGLAVFVGAFVFMRRYRK